MCVVRGLLISSVLSSIPAHRAVPHIVTEFTETVSLVLIFRVKLAFAIKTHYLLLLAIVNEGICSAVLSSTSVVTVCAQTNVESGGVPAFLTWKTRFALSTETIDDVVKFSLTKVALFERPAFVPVPAALPTDPPLLPAVLHLAKPSDAVRAEI